MAPRTTWGCSSRLVRHCRQTNWPRILGPSREGGLMPTPVTRTSDLGVRTFERPDPNGGSFVALLTVFRLREGEFSTQFEASSSRSHFGIDAPPGGSPRP
jgi:hypothetical protein